MEMEIRFPFSTQAAKDILATAIEQGSVYWLQHYECEYTRETATRGYYFGLRVRLVDIDRAGEFDVKPENERITLQSIADALALMAAGKCDEHGSDVRRVFGNIVRELDADGCAADAGMSDAVLQVAVFGRIVYG